MRAARLDRPAPLAAGPGFGLVDVPDPVPGPGEVLMAVAACGVCRTDLQLVEGDLPARRLPVIPGHQIVGTVLATGPGVDPARTGTAVGIPWLAGSCGTCRFCTTGRENLCPDGRFTGWDRDGGFAERATAAADVAFELPAGLAPADAAPLLCGGVIGYRSLRVAGVAPGQRLGLYGFGASATLAIQIAVHWGCEVYVATRSPTEQRRALALGAQWAGSYDDRPPVPLDAAVTFAPSGAVVVAALRALDRGGTVAINAIHLDGIPAFDYDDLWLERSIRSVANVTRADVEAFLQLAATIPIRTQVARYPLAEVARALADLAAGRVSGAAVLEMA